MIKQIMFLLLTVSFLCGCAIDKEAIPLHNIEQQKDGEIQEIPSRLCLVLKSPHEVEQFITFIGSNLENDGKFSRDQDGNIAYSDGQMPKITAEKMKEGLEKGGYPYFDEEPESYNAYVYYPNVETDKNGDVYLKPLDYYEVIYMKNSVIYRMIYLHKDSIDDDLADFNEYDYDISVDGFSAKLKTSDGKLLSNIIKLNDEYYLRMIIYTLHNTTPVDYTDINFDGVHLFK